LVPESPYAGTTGWIRDWLAAFVATAALAGGLTGFFSLSAAVPGLALVTQIALGLVLWQQRGRGTRLTAADRVTLARSVPIAILVGLLADTSLFLAQPTVIFSLAAVAVLMDGADGLVARRLGCETRAGARFDMELDGFALLVLAAWVASLDRAGPWVLLIGAWRYLFIMAGRFHPPLQRPLAFSQRRRVICGLQGVGLVICLLPGLPHSATQPLAAALVALVSYSFIVDLLALARPLSKTGANP